jgi:hypothetical protein
MLFVRHSMLFEPQALPFAREGMFCVPAIMSFISAAMPIVSAAMQSIPAGRDIVSAGIPWMHRAIANGPDASIFIAARGLRDRGGWRFDLKAIPLARVSREGRGGS